MAKTPDFAIMKQTVLEETIGATSSYGLLTSLVFPLFNQPQLREHYPFVIDSLYFSVSGHVIMTVCRLFDPDDDRRHASLSNFLRRVPHRHANDDTLPVRFQSERLAYEQAIPERLEEIAAGWAPLATYRNAYWAHRDLTKVGPTTFTYADLRRRIETAQRIIGEYISAYEDATQTFEVLELGREPQEFMRWCRLDDYARHFAESRKKRLGGAEGTI